MTVAPASSGPLGEPNVHTCTTLTPNAAQPCSTGSPVPPETPQHASVSARQGATSSSPNMSRPASASKVVSSAHAMSLMARLMNTGRSYCGCKPPGSTLGATGGKGSDVRAHMCPIRRSPPSSELCLLCIENTEGSSGQSSSSAPKQRRAQSAGRARPDDSTGKPSDSSRLQTLEVRHSLFGKAVRDDTIARRSVGDTRWWQGQQRKKLKLCSSCGMAGKLVAVRHPKAAWFGSRGSVGAQREQLSICSCASTLLAAPQEPQRRPVHNQAHWRPCRARVEPGVPVASHQVRALPHGAA